MVTWKAQREARKMERERENFIQHPRKTSFWPSFSFRIQKTFSVSSFCESVCQLPETGKGIQNCEENLLTGRKKAMISPAYTLPLNRTACRLDKFENGQFVLLHGIVQVELLRFDLNYTSAYSYCY